MLSLYYTEATRNGSAVIVAEHGLAPAGWIYNETERTDFIRRVERALDRHPLTQIARYFPRTGTVELIEKRARHRDMLLMR